MDASDGLPTPRRYWSMLAIGLAITMAVLDTSIANVALPTIVADLHAQPADAIWVINAYQIVVAVSVLPLASLSDRLGRRTTYHVGLAVFAAASLACAFSNSIAMLVAARLVQGLGAAAITSTSGALIRFTYPRARLGQAIGVSALVVASASTVGPTIASAILSVGSWRWLFGVNVPLWLVTAALAALALPRTPRSPHPFDVVSAILSAAALGLGIYGLEGLSHRASGWASLELAAGVAAGWAVVRRGARSPAPLVPVDLFRSRSFALAAATNTCSFVAQAIALVGMPFMMQASLGRTAVQTGLLITPWPLAAGLTAPVAGRLADRFPAGLLGGIGLSAFAVGLVLLATLPTSAGDIDIIWRMAFCGMGFILFQTPNNRAMMAGAPPERAGAAGGTVSTARLIGQTLGAAALAMMFRLEPAHATRLGLWIAAGVAAAAAVMSSLRLRRSPELDLEPSRSA